MHEGIVHCLAGRTAHGSNVATTWSLAPLVAPPHVWSREGLRVSMLLFEIVLLGVGIAIAVAVMAVDLDNYGARRSAAQEEARAAVQAAERLVRDQATGCRTGGPRPPAHSPQPLAAWVDDAVLRALEEL